METQDKRRHLMALRRMWAAHSLDSLFTVTADLGDGLRVDEVCFQIVVAKK